MSDPTDRMRRMNRAAGLPKKHSRTQNREKAAAREKQEQASKVVLPAVEELKKYGNVAIAVLPGASELKFLANLATHYSDKDHGEGTSTTIIPVEALGAVQGLPIHDRAARSIFSSIAYATRGTSTGQQRAVVVVRGIDHTPLRSNTARGNDQLREGLTTMAKYELKPGPTLPGELEPAVLAIGGIGSQAIANGILRRRVNGEEFIDCFSSYMALKADGTLSPYSIRPIITVNTDPSSTSPSASVERTKIPIVQGGIQLGISAAEQKDPFQ